jgi:DNA-binding LytR/AlgR family response regulator
VDEGQRRRQIRLIDVDEVLFFQSDTKYTRVVLRDYEALVRTPLKDLLAGLDGERFWQIHRGTVVNATRSRRWSGSMRSACRCCCAAAKRS